MLTHSYELSKIEWKLNQEQLNKKFLLFYDGRVIDRNIWGNSTTSSNDLELAIKSTAYQIITAEYHSFFIREVHRIQTALANHNIDDPVDRFCRYVQVNYKGLVKLHNDKIHKPADVLFNSPGFAANYRKIALQQIKYDLQTHFVKPLKITFETDYQSQVFPHPYIHSISEQPSIYEKSAAPEYRRLRWRGHINKLVTILFELANTDLFEGKPILGASPSEVTDHIYNSFVDRKGNNLSKETIRTILKPSRTDKRAPEHKKYKIPK